MQPTSDQGKAPEPTTAPIDSAALESVLQVMTTDLFLDARAVVSGAARIQAEAEAGEDDEEECGTCQSPGQDDPDDMDEADVTESDGIVREAEAIVAGALQMQKEADMAAEADAAADGADAPGDSVLAGPPETSAEIGPEGIADEDEAAPSMDASAGREPRSEAAEGGGKAGGQSKDSTRRRAVRGSDARRSGKR
jgi:hypothetical protein